MRSRIAKKAARMSGLAALCASAVALLGPGTSAASTLTSAGPITLSADGISNADQYPSTIPVSGLPGTVEKVRVSLNGFEGDNTEDLDIVLVGPAGQASMVLSDACAIPPDPTNVTLTFDDAAAAPLDNLNCPVGGGTFKPTNYFVADNFPAPGPGLGDFSLPFTIFNGTVPNGSWNLFVRDDENNFGAHGTVVSSWSIHLDLKTRCSGRFVTDAGTAGNDVIEGTSDIDVIAGFAGNDTIRGLGDEDVLCGGDGKDKLFGGAGKDRLNGEGGKDKLVGGGGRPDICNGAGGKDTARSCEREKKL